MKMFLGEYNPNITDGSRVALPKRLRDQITGDDVVLAKGFEHCIFLYDRTDWLLEAEKQVENPISDAKTRDLKRYMFAGALETTIDAQGRIVLPATLKEYAGIDKKTTVIGAGDHVEVWDTAKWQEYLAKISQELTA